LRGCSPSDNRPLFQQQSAMVGLSQAFGLHTWKPRKKVIDVTDFYLDIWFATPNIIGQVHDVRKHNGRTDLSGASD
jgi:hypothetical protein